MISERAGDHKSRMILSLLSDVNHINQRVN